jgi:mannose-1-phosphate guanylyltransferase
MRMVPASFAWWDLGTWASVAGFDAGLMDRESQDQDRVARVRSEDCFVHQLPGSDRRVALLGVADLVVVDAGDALLIAHKDSVADTKDLVAFLGSLGWSDVL